MRHLSFLRLALLPALLLGLASAAAGGPREPEPAPWGQVQWGMTGEMIQELYPDLELDWESTNMSQEREGGSLLTMSFSTAVLESQSFGPVQGCRVQFWFVDQALWQIQFKCEGADPKEVRRVLVNRYGFPRITRRHHLAWQEGPTAIGLNEKSGQFTLSDPRKDRSLTATGFIEALRSGGQAAQEVPEPPSEPGDGSEAALEEISPSGSTGSEEAPEAPPQEATDEEK